MNTVWDLAQTQADYMAALASAGAAGHVSVSALRVLRRRALRPMRAARRAARHALLYAVAIGGTWVLFTQFPWVLFTRFAAAG